MSWPGVIVTLGVLAALVALAFSPINWVLIIIVFFVLVAA